MTGKAKSTIGQMTQGARPSRRGPLRTGRISKLTPEVSKKICDAVRAGNFVSVAARYAGVSEYTVNDWISRGRGTHAERSSSPMFVRFVHDLDEAQAASEVAAVLHWRAAMPKDWKSAEKWLEVTKPERWRRVDDQTMRNGAFAGVQVNIGGQTLVPPSEDAQGGLSAPLEALLEENPALIAGAMQVLDQFLPIAPNPDESAQIGAGSASAVQTDAIPGEFTEIAPESEPIARETHFGPTSSPFDDETDEMDSESSDWRNRLPNESNWDN